MPCRLCHKDKPLRKSHVIPEFMYTPLYDEVHRFHVLSASVRTRRYVQKGLRERLLCKSCEALLSPYEKYVSEVLTGRIPITSARSGDLVELKGLDYKKFRLFGLSVLWRAGVSSLPMFANVNLGPHEDPLRKQLIAEDPGVPHQYSFFLAPLVRGDKLIEDVMVQPTRARLDGHLCYRFVFGGLIWVFVVSSHRPPAVFRNAFINEDGRMLMLVSEITDVGFVHNAARDLVAHIERDR